MRLLLVNGVYGAKEHFDTLRTALAPEVETSVFPFRRGGLGDPIAATGFAPMCERLHRAVTWYESEGGEPPALLGFSLGGALALEFAMAYPERVSRLILVNAFGRYVQGPIQAGPMRGLRFWRSAWSDPWLTARVINRMPAMKRGLFHPEATIDSIERGLRLAAVGMSHDDVMFQLAHLRLREPVGYADRVKAVSKQIPTLLISSRNDLVVPPRHTAWLARHLPEAKVLPPFEGGHAFFQHDPRPLAAAIREFLGAEGAERKAV